MAEVMKVLSAVVKRKRDCGGCTVCCWAMGVEAIDLAPFATCPHSTAGAGCSIYETRPEKCSQWHCSWVADDEFLSERDRPDRGGLLFYPIGRFVLPNGNALEKIRMLKCQESSPGAFAGFRSDGLFQRLLKRGYVLVLSPYIEEEGATTVQIRVPENAAIRQYVHRQVNGG